MSWPVEHKGARVWITGQHVPQGSGSTKPMVEVMVLEPGSDKEDATVLLDLESARDLQETVDNMVKKLEKYE